LLSTDAASFELFEASVAAGADAKKAANWIQNDVARLRAETPADGHLDPRSLAELIHLVEAGTIGSSVARQVLAEVMRTGKSPAAVVEEQGLAQVSDSGELEAAVRAAIDANPAAVA